VQVAGDPVPVFEQGQPLGVLAVLGQLKPDPGLRRESDQHLHRRG
jgi:hypothetical protein